MLSRFGIFISLIILISCEEPAYVASQPGETANQEETLALGSITDYDRNSAYILSVPHGKYDINTGDLGESFCQQINWDCIIAEGYRSKDHPINVSRPTEGIGVSTGYETLTSRAQIVFDAYMDAINSIIDDNYKLYVEIHGHSRAESAWQIEIATVGLSIPQSERIKYLLQNELDLVGLPDYEILVENIDDIYYKAQSSKSNGTLSNFSPVIHMEFPIELRRNHLSSITEFIISALPNLVAQEF